MPNQFPFNYGRRGTVGIRLVFFLGLTLLIAGIFVLNAQEDDQASGDEQAASATAPAEKTAPVVPKEATPEVKGAAVEPVKIPPAAIPAPEADASPKQTPAALPPAEASPALSVVKPEQAKPEPVVESKDSEKSQESKNGERLPRMTRRWNLKLTAAAWRQEKLKRRKKNKNLSRRSRPGKSKKARGFSAACSVRAGNRSPKARMPGPDRKRILPRAAMNRALAFKRAPRT